MEWLRPSYTAPWWVLDDPLRVVTRLTCGVMPRLASLPQTVADAGSFQACCLSKCLFPISSASLFMHQQTPIGSSRPLPWFDCVRQSSCVGNLILNATVLIMGRLRVESHPEKINVIMRGVGS
jgi:hypothetical protein